MIYFINMQYLKLSFRDFIIRIPVAWSVYVDCCSAHLFFYKLCFLFIRNRWCNMIHAEAAPATGIHSSDLNT